MGPLPRECADRRFTGRAFDEVALNARAGRLACARHRPKKMDSEQQAQRKDSPRAVYEFQLSEAECIAALEFNQSRLIGKLRRSYFAIALRTLTIGAAATLSFLTIGLLLFERSKSLPWFAGALFAWMALTLASQLLMRHRLFRGIASMDSKLGDRRTITLEKDGLRSSSARGESWLGWHSIQSIEEHRGLLLIYFDHISFVAVPCSAFVDGAERDLFLEALRRCAFSPDRSTRNDRPIQSAIKAATLPRSASTAGEGESRRRATLHAHVEDGFRLAFFRRPTLNLSTSEQSWSALVALIFLTIAVSFLSDRVQNGAKGSFNTLGLLDVLFVVPVTMVGAWAFAAVARRTRETLGLLTAMTSLAVAISLVEIPLGFWVAKHAQSSLAVQGFVLQSFIFSIWFTLASSVAAIRLLGTPRIHWSATFLLAAVLIALPLITVQRSETLWGSSDEESFDGVYDDAKYFALSNEEVFYLQPGLLEKQLAAMKPGRRGVIDLYFIGVAAWADQDVFMREVLSMATLFDERFDTAGRSLMLINNASTVRVLPIATATGLGMSLKRVGEIMDQDEDILFLFITSHGSSQDGVAFEFSPVKLDQVSPKRLKELLDRYGIKRRVVVVSACYSGSFADALKDEDTVVITASANDRNSFGCSNEADFTFFGKAYFEALQNTYSFTEAFERAKPVIAERERQEHFTHSEPRMFVGESIKQHLEKLVKLRESSAKGTSAALAE